MPKKRMRRFPEIIGKTKQIHEVYKIIEKVIKTDSNILITGETGTGKELVARAIHNYGPRKNANFVAVNCSALTETLLETELFGHVKGSFTGATAEKKGLFEIADKGTFFMDEIGDITQNVQSKLLRVIQEGIIKKVGGLKDISIDVRIIAATNKDLESEIKEESFRKDLYYRLSVIQINIPSLRERKLDIPLLANHFLKKYGNKLNKDISSFIPETMRILTEYDWPGNIRELEHEVERAMVLTERNSIAPEDLSERIRTGGRLKLEEIKDKSLKGVIDEYESQIIKEMLFGCRWNKSKTAEALGLSRQALNKKIDKYVLDRRKQRRQKCNS